MTMARQTHPLGLYLHIPFCRSKCAYCDFYSLSGQEDRMDAYTAALERHLIEVAPQAAQHLVDTVYFGGGTPSYLGEKRLVKLLKAVKKHYRIAPHAEITLEANPETVTEETLRGFRAAGVNRISFGVQSARDTQLRTLGRPHTAKQARAAFAAARRAGFENISGDIMLALPHYTQAEFDETLELIAEGGATHISAYLLKIEPDSAFGRHPPEGLPSPDEAADFYLYAVEHLEHHGYRQYEISNYARKGFECRHNLIYWQRKDYLGLGLGAASLLGMERFSNTADMQEYLKNSSAPEKIRKNRELLTREDEMAEFMFLGLRMTQGVSKKEFQEYFGTAIENIYGEVLKKYKKQGLLLEESGRIFLSREGIHVSNAVMAEFLL